MVPFTFVGNHDVTRILTQLENTDLLRLALGTLVTVPGTPAIYYGDEFGWTGRKEHRPGGDDAIRPALPPAPPTVVPDGTRILEWHREMTAFRRSAPWITRARVEVL